MRRGRILCGRGNQRKAHVGEDRQGGARATPTAHPTDGTSDSAGQRHRPRDQRSGAAVLGTRPRPAAQPAPTRSRTRTPAHAIPADIEAKQLAPEVRGNSSRSTNPPPTSSPATWWPQANCSTRTPRRRWRTPVRPVAGPGRLAAVREAVGIAAYQCGDWAQALAELRAARRMGSKSPLLPLIADCERGVGRPERAIELARSPEAAELTGDDADELRIVDRRCPIRSRTVRAGAGDPVDAAAGPDAHRSDRGPAVLRVRRYPARTGPQR